MNFSTRILVRPRAHRDTRGFSLLELMLVIVVLLTVSGVIMRGIIEMQHRNTAETSKVDTVQQTRDFIDQMVRDVHQVGYPPGRVIAGNPSCVNNASVSCGVILFSPTQVIYEGDLEGTGNVYQIWMQLLPPASGRCPCTLQRGVILKAQALAGNVPTYFTEVNGVLNSGNGAGGSNFPISLPGPGTYTSYANLDVFDAYFNDASLFVSPTGTYSCDEAAAPLSCSGIRSLQISVNVTSNFADPKTNTYPVYSITSKARLNN